MYKVILDLSLNMYSSDLDDPSFVFENWNDVQAFVDICFKNGYGVKIEPVIEKLEENENGRD